MWHIFILTTKVWDVKKNSCQRDNKAACTSDQQDDFGQWRETCQTVTGVKCTFYGSAVCKGKPLRLQPMFTSSFPYFLCLAHLKYVKPSFTCHTCMHYVSRFRHFPLCLFSGGNEGGGDREMSQWHQEAARGNGLQEQQVSDLTAFSGDVGTPFLNWISFIIRKYQ